MAKKNKPTQARKASISVPAFERGREYLVYWKSGLKTVCNGFRLSQAVAFYLSRASRIVDADTRGLVWQA